MKFDLADTLRAIAALAGIGLVGYGAWLHYPPLGFITAGVMLAGLGLLATLRAH